MSPRDGNASAQLLIVPEFGSLALLVAAVGIVSVLIALSRFGRRLWHSR